nr:predicted protein [Ipomoea batatas]
MKRGQTSESEICDVREVGVGLSESCVREAERRELLGRGLLCRGLESPSLGTFRSSPTSSFAFSSSSPLIKWIYLIVYEPSPETSQGSLVRIFGQNGSARKSVVDILENDKRLSDWVSVVQEDRDFLVDRVGFEKQGGLVGEILLYEFIFNALEFESKLNSCAKRACPTT